MAVDSHHSFIVAPVIETVPLQSLGTDVVVEQVAVVVGFGEGKDVAAAEWPIPELHDFYFPLEMTVERIARGLCLLDRIASFPADHLYQSVSDRTRLSRREQAIRDRTSAENLRFSQFRRLMGLQHANSSFSHDFWEHLSEVYEDAV